MMYRISVLFFSFVLGCSACSLNKGKPTENVSTSAKTAPGGLNTSEINTAVAALWSEEGVTPAPAAEDAEFLRRVSLDVIGRIPTAEEARLFLDDTAPNKRELVVDRLLASSEYAEHWSEVYFDLLISGEAKQLARAEAPRQYLLQSFQQNKPYNQLATELITATGDLNENGAVAFIASQAKSGGVERVAATTAELFLGIQIQCAQCHDHPYDARYKQEDFYGLVAYFAQTRPKLNKEEKSLSVVDVGRGEAKMKRPGAEKEERITPKFLGHEALPKGDQSRRQALAGAIEASDLFAKSMVNRTWAHLFGRGLVEPFNDLGGELDSNHPPLLTKLSKDFIDAGYDQKVLLKKILLSEPYALSSRGEPNPASDPQQKEQVFARAAIRPLSSSQLFRSLYLATNLEEMAKKRVGNEERLQKMKKMALREYEFVFGNDEMSEVSAFDGNIPQALLLLNGEIVNRGSLSKAGSQLEKIIAASPDKATRLENIFLTVYGRRPTTEEVTTLSAYLSDNKDKPQAYEDVFFALLTSTEFITNH
jgi:hypothetical protein